MLVLSEHLYISVETQWNEVLVLEQRCQGQYRVVLQTSVFEVILHICIQWACARNMLLRAIDRYMYIYKYIGTCCARGGCRAGLRLLHWWHAVWFDVCVVSSLAACIAP